MPKERSPEILTALQNKAAGLPLSPGVYIMHGEDGKVIYVGKSRALRNRVSQYFHGTHDVKTTRMAGSVYTFDFIVCDTEMEALALENRLIKQYKPRYNIKLKDAKSYPYIRLNTEEPYPRLSVTRKRLDDNAQYFGPYTGSGTAFGIVHTVENSLKLPTCQRKFPEDIGRERPCLYKQMGKCIGVCSGGVPVAEYRAIVKCASSILRGNTREAAADLTARMNEAAENLRFEEAARCRDALQALKKLGERQKAVGSPELECDVIGKHTAEDGDCLTVFYVRGGYIADTEHFLFTADEITEQEDGENPMSAFLLSFYQTREYIPQEILLSFPMSDEELATLSLSLNGQTERKRKIAIRVPQRGEARALCMMAVTDARSHAENERTRAEGSEETLAELASLLSLEVLPQRIECYDISNIGAEHITAGMIVATDGQFDKREYRLFKIRSVSEKPDDYGSMREALARRLAHLGESREGMGNRPDLILLDGGRGHVRTVRELLRETGTEIPVFGMVKDGKHRTRALTDEENEYPLPATLYRFVYGLQEEVHRYTVSHMSEAKSKTLKHSTLENIEGVGAVKAKNLLAYFGTLTKIKEATAEELQKVKGISRSDAIRIYQHFHGDTDTENPM